MGIRAKVALASRYGIKSKIAHEQEAQARNLPSQFGAFNSAWDPDRPLPIPSNEWVDRKVKPI